MPMVCEIVANAPDSEIECKVLYLPSNFKKHEFDRLALGQLGELEKQLRIGQANDCLGELRSQVKYLHGLNFYKCSQVRNQGPNTKCNIYIGVAKDKLELLMTKYNHTRNALINLGFTDINDGDQFPLLESRDVVMKATEIPKGKGDSNLTDGKLWRIGGQRKVVAKANMGSTSSNPGKQRKLVFEKNMVLMNTPLMQTPAMTLGENLPKTVGFGGQALLTSQGKQWRTGVHPVGPDYQ